MFGKSGLEAGLFFRLAFAVAFLRKLLGENAEHNLGHDGHRCHPLLHQYPSFLSRRLMPPKGKASDSWDYTRNNCESVRGDPLNGDVARLGFACSWGRTIIRPWCSGDFDHFKPLRHFPICTGSFSRISLITGCSIPFSAMLKATESAAVGNRSAISMIFPRTT